MDPKAQFYLSQNQQLLIQLHRFQLTLVIIQIIHLLSTSLHANENFVYFVKNEMATIHFDLTVYYERK